MTVLAYGALNPDLVHHVDRIPRPGDDLRSSAWHFSWGGKVANAAVALAGWGSESRLSGLVVGDDPLGAALLEMLHRPGIDLRHLETSPNEATRHCVVLIGPDGDRTIVCTGYDGASWSVLGGSAWDAVEVVLLDGFSGAAGRSVAEESARRGLPVVWIDPTPTDTRLAQVAIWSAAEHTEDELVESEAALTVLTSGSGPIRVRSLEGDSTVVPPPVEAIDATGSGDVFAAGCVWGVARNWPFERVVTWAAAAGAALASKGREAGMPTIADVEALLC